MSERLASIVEALGEPFYRDAEGCALYHGDSLELLPMLPANCIDSIVTDPPYGLSFMGREWDRGVPGVAFWQAMLTAAKPGATLLSFGGTRTYHRMACAIEDAGWEIRDCIQWIYGSGFPKSLDVSKAIDKAAGAEREIVGVSSNWRESKRDREVNGQMEVRGANAGLLDAGPATPAAREWSGYGTALKPANEPICVAMKPLDGTFAKNAERWGVAGLNIDGGRIETGENLNGGAYAEVGGRQVSQSLRAGSGMNVVGKTTGREYQQPSGRWPANVIHDGSEEVVGLFPDAPGQQGDLRGHDKDRQSPNGCFGKMAPARDHAARGDSGSAARFFYAAKASRKERGAYNTHPTVKPLSLMEYLCRLTMTPTGGIVLDPFAGSGTTLLAARKLGRPCIGFEKDEAHCEIIAKRLNEGRMQFA